MNMNMHSVEGPCANVCFSLISISVVSAIDWRVSTRSLLFESLKSWCTVTITLFSSWSEKFPFARHRNCGLLNEQFCSALLISILQLWCFRWRLIGYFVHFMTGVIDPLTSWSSFFHASPSSPGSGCLFKKKKILYSWEVSNT